MSYYKNYNIIIIIGIIIYGINQSSKQSNTRKLALIP